MRILKEDNNPVATELPISFITDMISKGWEEVGYLRDAREAIKADYQDTEKVEQLMQDFMDAYLVFIGQLEAYLHKEDYIEAPEMDKSPESTPELAITDKAEEVPELPEAELEVEPIIEPTEPEQPEVESTVTKQPDEISKANDAFEFFVDFDEPDLSEPRLTDDDLYGHEDSEFEHNKLKMMLDA